MTHTISLHQSQELTIIANQPYSDETISVEPNEEYDITCNENQRWKDWFIKTTPKGFFNPLASLAGLRKKGVKCFCLCGVYDKNDATAFAIGIGVKIQSPNSKGILSFFANDARGAYGNNSGEIKILVTRVK